MLSIISVRTDKTRYCHVRDFVITVYTDRTNITVSFEKGNL